MDTIELDTIEFGTLLTTYTAKNNKKIGIFEKDDQFNIVDLLDNKRIVGPLAPEELVGWLST